MQNFNKYFDHTLLKPDATDAEIEALVKEAIDYDFAAVCVNGCHTSTARSLLDEANSNVKLAAVVGFPLGAMNMEAKIEEAEMELLRGANEIDMVMNIGCAKSGDWDYVEEEIERIAEACHFYDAILKVIIETCLLTKDEIIQACQTVVEANGDFVKTSTGFSSGGAKVEDIKLMKKTVDKALTERDDIEFYGICAPVRTQIKASGGIRTLESAQALIEAGADRLGCSASVKIMEEYEICK